MERPWTEIIWYGRDLAVGRKNGYEEHTILPQITACHYYHQTCRSADNRNVKEAVMSKGKNMKKEQKKPKKKQ
jgi:hypothetical protein